jgi:hypothetical protein
VKINRVGILLLLAGTFTILSCGLSSVKPTATPPAPLQGRLLLLGNGEANGLVVLEFKNGMSAPQPLWTGIPGKVKDPSERPTPVIFASPDHKHAMVMLEFKDVLIIDLTSGAFTRLELPNREHASFEQYDLAGEFSPDGRYLAYALTGEQSTNSGMYLYDLTTQKQSTLFKSPCAVYGGQTIGLVCGEVESPVWLDSTTLAFSAFDGKPPKSTIGGSLRPNYIFVMDVTGKRLQEYSSVIYIQGANAQIILDRDGREWLDAADFKQGKITSHFLEGDVVDRAWMLTPDGSVLRWQRVRQDVKGDPFADTWHLTDLRSGADQELKNLSYCNDVLDIRIYGLRGVVWSPDGKSFACLSGSDLKVSYLDGSPRRILLESFNGYLIDWSP